MNTTCRHEMRRVWQVVREGPGSGVRGAMGRAIVGGHGVGATVAGGPLVLILILEGGRGRWGRGISASLIVGGPQCGRPACP